MIGMLKGKICDIDIDNIILDVADVGYKVFLPQTRLLSLQINSTLKLHIETIVKEDSISMYGFLEKDEKKWFNILRTVQGIGAKAALSVIDTLSPHSLIMAIQSQDVKTIKAAPGIGPKVAQRIITELSSHNELKNMNLIKKDDIITVVGNSNNFADALNALASLGFSRSEALKNLNEVNDNDLTTEELISRSLEKFGKM